ncbi:MAG: carbon-nitrogen hydrolase family protein [Verrucomicrobia bacterium]|jgi:predicted amidohydrolase|nr:carbon-nitrogen hydrolase family protein [Verrucomicrobiota bacterium]
MTVLRDISPGTANDDFQYEVASIHSQNGDSIEVQFSQIKPTAGTLSLGFQGGMEHAIVTVDFGNQDVRFRTSDWTRPQPGVISHLSMSETKQNTLILRKTIGDGDLVKMSNIDVEFNGTLIAEERNLHLLPEMGVFLKYHKVTIDKVLHKGIPRKAPKHLHIAGWQMLNSDSIDSNVESIRRGVTLASRHKVQLLVTPETSLTGLFPSAKVTHNKKEIAEAEKKIRRCLCQTKDAPYLVVGLPVWKKEPDHRKALTRFNVSRVYNPNGDIISTHAKIHSCETEFWHGYQLQEFDVYGVPICMHICHDGRYPEVWSLPVMFGARVIVNPSNGGNISGSIDSFEARAKSTVTPTAHAFYLHVNGGGGSFISGPQKGNNLLAVSEECKRTSGSSPMVGDPQECLIEASISVEEAYGYWPVRSFRASEEVASAYCNLYRAMGGKRSV